MIETLTIITISLILLVIFRPGKTPPLDRPLVIERPGQYHMMLAPKLNLAQPFIEAVAKKMAGDADATPNSATLYLEVSDEHVSAHGSTSYLLAITRRNRMLYCQAISPSGKEPQHHFGSIKQAADAVLSGITAEGEQGKAIDERLLAAAREEAKLRAIEIKPIAG